MPKESSIPDHWKCLVRKALDSHDSSRIIATRRAREDWSNTFPLAFDYQLWVALSDALKDPLIQGMHKEMDGAKESYAFFFTFEHTRLYAKVGLTSDDTVIIIFSSHRPLKGDTL